MYLITCTIDITDIAFMDRPFYIIIDTASLLNITATNKKEMYTYSVTQIPETCASFICIAI